MKFKDKKVIGITGGIGTGKTTVLNIFKTEFNADIIEADKIGHLILEPGTIGYQNVIDIFGEGILDMESKEPVKPIDRKKLGQIVFNSEKELEKLNSVTHPLIHAKIEDIINQSNNKLIIIEAAILITTSLKELCDEIWFIHADINTRIQRLSEGRGISKEKAMLVMNNQPDESDYNKECNVIIDNSYTVDNTLLQIKEHI